MPHALFRAAALAAALLALSAVPALCHAALIAADPAEGALTATAPATATLTFNEPVAPLSLRLFGPDGTAVDLHGTADAGRVRAALPEGAADGSYVLGWRVMSEDGHPASGAVSFAVGTRSTRPPQSDTDGQMSPAVAAGLWTTRMLVSVGLLFGVGGTVFRVLIQRAEGRPAGWTTGVLVAALAGCAACVGFQGCDLAGAGPGGLLDPATWRAGGVTAYGTSSAVAAAAIALALAAGRVAGRWASAFAVLGLSAGAASFALSGHAATAGGWDTRVAVFAHAAAAMVWIGALAPLANLLLRGDAGARTVLRRFSATILPSVGLLVVAGLWLSWRQELTPESALATGYGRLWLAKIGGVAVLLGLAAVNRVRFTPAFLRGRPVGAGFSRLVAAEACIAVVLLGAVAGWRFTPPPRAVVASMVAAARPAPGPTVHIHGKTAMTLVTFAAAGPGPNAAAIALLRPEGGRLAAQDVRIEISNDGAGLGRFSRTAVRTADGGWTVDDLVIPVAGRWTITVVALVSDFDQVRLTGTVAIARR